MTRGVMGRAPNPFPSTDQNRTVGIGFGGPDRTVGGDSGEPDWDPRGRVGFGKPAWASGRSGPEPPWADRNGRAGPSIGGHSHAPGTRPLRLKLGRTFGWRKFISTVGFQKKRWHSHAPGTRLLKLKLGRTFGWRKFASTVGSKKRGTIRIYFHPVRPPTWGDFGQGGAAGPSPSPPGPSVPEPLGSRVLTNSMDSTR